MNDDPAAASTVSPGRTTGALLWRGGELAALRGLSLLRLLVVARLVVPEVFGLFAVAQVVVATLMTLTDVGMRQALVQRAEVSERHRRAGWSVGLLRGLAIAAGVGLAAPAVAVLFGQPEAAPLVRWLALRPLIEALASMRLADLERHLQFRSLALVSVPAALVETVLAVALAPRLGAWALVLGVLAGGAVGTAASYLAAPWRPRLAAPSAARSLLRYGRWIFASGVLAVAGGALIQAVISRRLGAAELGLYYLAMKLAFLPSEVASQVVGRVAFPLYARLQGMPRRLAGAFRRLLAGQAAVLLPGYVLLILLAPWLAEVLGEGWRGSAELLRWLALTGVIGLFGDTVVPLLQGVGRPERVTALELVQSLALIVLALWLVAPAGPLGDPLRGAGVAWLGAVAASQLLAAVFLRRALSSRTDRVKR